MAAYQEGVQHASSEADQDAEALKSEVEARWAAKVEYAALQEERELERAISKLQTGLEQRSSGRSTAASACASEENAVVTCLQGDSTVACDPFVKALEACAQRALMSAGR
eukprot:TRINITY_DN617_c0_g1_i1.p1 TRINITY_DN617_c0_g1~~TRINITY_DN617_c0_g1_i1.p1  ORF type:complete len:110 (+),score=15.52 TRINITY_DN617_c0_g1_i1:498-827(+)